MFLPLMNSFTPVFVVKGIVKPRDGRSWGCHVRGGRWGEAAAQLLRWPGGHSACSRRRGHREAASGGRSDTLPPDCHLCRDLTGAVQAEEVLRAEGEDFHFPLVNRKLFAAICWWQTIKSLHVQSANVSLTFVASWLGFATRLYFNVTYTAILSTFSW